LAEPIAVWTIKGVVAFDRLDVESERSSNVKVRVVKVLKVVLARTDTVTKQAEIMVEAASAEQARQFILADLEVDAGSYDDDLRAVESDIGDITVAVENRHEPAHGVAQAANSR
jgi:hypothetical protein